MFDKVGNGELLQRADEEAGLVIRIFSDWAHITLFREKPGFPLAEKCRNRARLPGHQ